VIIRVLSRRREGNSRVAGPCAHGVASRSLGNSLVGVAKQAWPDAAEESADGRQAGADDADVDFDCAPVADLDVVPWYC
jgi:hypothetical protein